MSFVPNPAYMPHVEMAVTRGLRDSGAAMRDKAKANTSHPSVAQTLYASPVSRDEQGPVIVIRYRKGLGPIFESGTKTRYTKRGAARGFIQPGEFALSRARDEVVRRGLDLRRYL